MKAAVWFAGCVGVAMLLLGVDRRFGHAGSIVAGSLLWLGSVLYLATNRYR